MSLPDQTRQSCKLPAARTVQPAICPSQKADGILNAIWTGGHLHLLALLIVLAIHGTLRADNWIDIGSRRELFIDDFLVQSISGDVTWQLKHPVPRELVLEHDAPWEGSGSVYHSVFRDGDLYRMYYRAWNLDIEDGTLDQDIHPPFLCYAESDDGVHWRKPNLGLHAFRGSTANNIVIVDGRIGEVHADTGHPAVFKDDNPNCDPDARYKAIIRSNGPEGLLPFKSPDGIHWLPMTNAPVITEGAFDSQNLAFWDSTRQEYRAYWRIFTGNDMATKNGSAVRYRAIRTATSPDFLHWGPHTDLTYENARREQPSMEALALEPPPYLTYGNSRLEQLYTNQIKPYHRAPHIFVGFPTRYVDRGWSDSMRALPEPEHRQLRAKAKPRYGTALTEGLLMTSRDGIHFKRWNEAFLRPGIQRPGTWNYGQQFVAWHLVETSSSLPGAPDELSLYAGESYWTGKGSALRRYTIRIDGFVSLSAPCSGGELITKPLTFTGHKLTLNCSTSAVGGIRVELLQPDGQPFPGYTMADCQEVFGDELERVVSWRGGHNLQQFSHRPIRLRFALCDAEIFSFQFIE